MNDKERIEALMREYGLKPRKLALSVGVTPQNIYDIQKGKHGISKELADKISTKYLNISRLWLLTGEGEMTWQGKRIPLYDDTATIGGLNGTVACVDDAARPTEWIDAGDWFPTATSAIHHYGDSMVEYPSGCILALKRVNDPHLLINGENYVIETDEFRITKQLQDDGEAIIAYSTNRETYPDGRLIYAPIHILKSDIRHLDLVLGCIIKNFSSPIKFR